MAITIANIVSRFKALADADPRCNAFGAGPLYDIIDDIKYYPYLWIQNDVLHRINYTDINKYRAIEYSFILRVGDKVNDQPNVYQAYGENSNNGLDISSDTFTILVDMINAISENSLGLFGDFTMLDDVEVEPFFHEDTGDVNGHMAQIRLRAPLENPCISPITDDLPVGPTPSPPPPPPPPACQLDLSGCPLMGNIGSDGVNGFFSINLTQDPNAVNVNYGLYYPSGRDWNEFVLEYFPSNLELLNQRDYVFVYYSYYPEQPGPADGNPFCITYYDNGDGCDFEITTLRANGEQIELVRAGYPLNANFPGCGVTQYVPIINEETPWGGIGNSYFSVII